MSNPTKIPAQQIAELLECQVVGNSQAEIISLCSVEEQVAGAIAFTISNNPQTVATILETAKFSALIVRDSLDLKLHPTLQLAVFKVKSPFHSFLKVVELLAPKHKPKSGIASSAVISPSAKLGKNVSVSDYVVIGDNCQIGDEVILHPHVVLYQGVKIGSQSEIHSHVSIRQNVEIGSRCIIQNGSVIGADGFGYTADARGELHAVPQVGTVIISDSVEVGANSCIDRATLGTTVIGRNTKIDNLVQIGHNVKIGSNSIVCGQVGIAGSSKVGNHCVLGGHVGIQDHVEIANQVRLAAKSGVVNDIKKSGDYGGYPAEPANTWKRQMIVLKRLGEATRKHAKPKAE